MHRWVWAPAPGVTVALVPIDEMLSDTTALGRLRPEELRTAATMASWRAREHLVGRALLRDLLVGSLGEEGARSPLVPEPNGRPRLSASPATGVSVSHSGPYAAAAIGVGLDVGVDVQIPRAPSSGMLHRCCLPRTAARLAKMPLDRAARAFAEVWSVQEACVKAHGTGLSGAPWRVPVEPGQSAGAWGSLRWQRLPWPTAADARDPAALAFAFGPLPSDTRAGRKAGGPPADLVRAAPLLSTQPVHTAPSVLKDPDAH
ncbi:4'-phosphopantetheinyl transferase superfamily protein [Streptomyces sp. AC602_WCS936]|uniref:4'-phosphopantetheinyl transferase family protein n=1 Tax=Streptomyces sp. AC602_WCS936 TaxID=2823685 RepID=UPI001C276CBE|nr:4'-phosphopantetheinyl transferase superfamily protein [Streptomyces sp. AC602_WCS936]